MIRSRSTASRAGADVTCIMTEGAAVSIARNIPACGAWSGLKMTATRVMRGASSLNTSSNFPNTEDSAGVKPRARQAGNEAGLDGIDNPSKNDRDAAGLLLH